VCVCVCVCVLNVEKIVWGLSVLNVLTMLSLLSKFVCTENVCACVFVCVCVCSVPLHACVERTQHY